MRGCLENVAVLQIADEEVLGRRRREKERMLVPGENPVGTDDDDVRRRLEALAERSRRQHEAELETKLQLIHRQQEQEKRKQDEENTKRILDAEQKDAKLRSDLSPIGIKSRNLKKLLLLFQAQCLRPTDKKNVEGDGGICDGLQGQD